MIKFETSIVIAQPVEKVFAFTANFNNNPKWQTDVLVAQQTSQGPIGLGSTYCCANKFLGKRIETVGFVSEYEPDRRCSYKITSGTVTGESSFIFEPVGGATKLTATGIVNRGFLWMASSLIVRKIQQQLQKDLNKLKHILENGS